MSRASNGCCRRCIWPAAGACAAPRCAATGRLATGCRGAPGSWGAPTARRPRSSYPTSPPARTTSRPTPASSPRRASRCSRGGLTVGVLNVESREPLQDGDLEHLRACARALGARIEELGRPAPRVGHPAPAAPRRRHGRAAGPRRGRRRAAQRRPRPRPAGLRAARAHHRPRGRLRPSRAAGPLAPVLRAAPARVDRGLGRRTGSRCFTVGEPARRPPANLADLRAAGVETLVAVGLFVHGELLGALVLASDEPAVIGTDDVELLEQLATHGAACLRTAELMGSLRERAETDPLTGLGHHATFHEALAGSHRRPTTAVVVCDIDGFKLLNDTYGHGHGDRVLCGVADAMSGALRRGDRLFRVGGDEFAALLAVESREQALGRRRRACATRSLEARLGVTVSVGVAVPQAGRDRRRAAGARRPGALLGQGGRPRRRRAGQRRAAAVDARPRLSAVRAGGRAGPILGRRTHGRPGTHPQLLDHRPHRPREVDAGRPHPRDHPHGRSAPDARAGARLDGPRARARDHDQGPGRARLLRGARRRDLPAAAHRHARATSTSPTRSRAAWRRARARCSSSTRRRASRPRRWPTPTWPSTRGSS